MGVLLREAKGSRLTCDQYDEGLAEHFLQAAHGLAQWDIVYTAAGVVTKAIAGSTAAAKTSLATGIILHVEDINQIWVRFTPGVLDWPAHGFTLDRWAWLHASVAGTALDSAAGPASGWIQELFKPTTTDQILWAPNYSARFE